MLTDAAVRNAKPSIKAYKIFDEKGLFLHVTPAGSKLWRFKFRVDGVEKLLAFGSYPDTLLSKARDLRDDARKKLASGVDPAIEKKIAKRAKAASNMSTFGALAQVWFSEFSPSWAPAHASRVWKRIERDILPWLTKVPVADVSALDVLDIIKRIDSRGARETAHRARSDMNMIMRYAVSNGLASRNPVADTLGAIPTVSKRHFAAVTEPKALGKLLVLMDGYQGSHVVSTALKLQPIVFCRPGELRHMRWEHLDFDKGLWLIPAKYMKMKKDHIVPLSKQALVLIQDMPKVDGNPFVFTGQRGQGRPMSDMATGAALRCLGVDTQTHQTMHGFRATARTILHEVLGVSPPVIESSLAHQPAGPLKATYDRTTFLVERTKMMQQWADYLDGLKAAYRSTI